jgi:UDP-glucose 4-epimerase
MQVLITGGAGFIGSHLAERLLERGDEVHVLDDLSTGSIQNIAHMRSHPRFHYYIDSIYNRQLSAELVDLCDIIYHLAAAVGVRLIVESPVRTLENNIQCTEIILALAAKKRKRVLITSTSEVYGKREHTPFSESDDLLMGPPDKGRWSYACSKAIDEFLAVAYWKERRVPTVIVRLFNTVGPRQTSQYGMVIPTFVGQALQNHDVTVFGTGAQSRCFLHVRDAVDALIGLAEHRAAVGEVYNVGSDEEIGVLDLAYRIIDMAGSSSQVIKVPYAEAYEEGFEDMMRRLPDIRKVNTLLGWRPTVSLDEILSEMIDFEREGVAGRSGAYAPFGATPIDVLPAHG